MHLRNAIHFACCYTLIYKAHSRYAAPQQSDKRYKRKLHSRIFNFHQPVNISLHPAETSCWNQYAKQRLLSRLFNLRKPPTSSALFCQQTQLVFIDTHPATMLQNASGIRYTAFFIHYLYAIAELLNLEILLPSLVFSFDNVLEQADFIHFNLSTLTRLL